ncbi:MurR/RpiR family transcriptional regulator [Agromyces sp. G08B096]|uniref:MurR/RpiR family transcriptional regulator n=1 Tax=Agromyces sp. G08B096 TaxID=3156399 RepID=A0AAU7W7J2_9MICO
MTAASAQPASVAEAIRRGLGDCTPAERKVGRVLLASYPSAGFETVAKLAARAGVSGPTVVRFANRLGYSGFPEFQQALRDDLDQRSASPLSIYDRAREAAGEQQQSPEGGVLERAAATTVQTVDATFRRLAPHDFDACVELLADAKGSVWLAGGRYSGLLARFLAQHLLQLRPRVAMLPDDPSTRAAVVAGLGRADALVVFDYRRYEESTRSLVEHVRAQRVPVVLFTDAWLSPIASEADVVVQSETTSASPFDAMTPALALVEAVIAGCLERLGDRATERMRRIERSASQLGLY